MLAHKRKIVPSVQMPERVPRPSLLKAGLEGPTLRYGVVPLGGVELRLAFILQMGGSHD